MSHEDRPESSTDTEQPDEAAEQADEPESSGELDPSEQLSEEIREELEELEELRDRHLRLAAEFENYRKRTRKEMAETRERAQAALAERLLDALDDLERFLDQPADETSAASLREGVGMVRDKLWKELGEAGLERMDARGDPFDPELHDALLTRPVEDPGDEGLVSEVLMNGYVFGDRVLRPARVEVTRHQADEDGGEGDGAGSGDESADASD